MYKNYCNFIKYYKQLFFGYNQTSNISLGIKHNGVFFFKYKNKLMCQRVTRKFEVEITTIKFGKLDVFLNSSVRLIIGDRAWKLAVGCF